MRLLVLGAGGIGGYFGGRLAAAGVSAADLDRIDAPVGLDIGAIGPSEIALSIAAAMVGRWRAKR